MPDLSDFKQVMFNSLPCINFMYSRRNEAFQLQGRYDGSTSEECKELFRHEFEFWDALIKEHELTEGK